ncbi:MAG: hypothetical protein ACD_63C00096G0003 [uncultured bacterium]|nr:MAG: hypothetical protein ACD_63C00096G0003 [uncultured bacterium]
MLNLITDFLEYCEIDLNRSEKTIQNYKHYLERFSSWMAVKSPSAITLPLIKKYRLKLNRYKDKAGKPLKKITQAYHVIALRSFLKYLAKQDIKTLASEKIELPKAESRIIQFLDEEELERLLKAPMEFLEKNESKNKSKEKSSLQKTICVRDKAILELLFSTGLRVSELCNLNKKDINLKKNEFTVIGKGDKPRIVFLSDTAKKALKQYLDLRHDNFNALLIPCDKKTEGKTGKNTIQNQPRITPRSIQRIIKKYSQLAGITKDITTHSLRHTFATDLLTNGADIRSVQAMLGHASITTTQIYTHITNQQLRDIHKAFHGKKRR